MGSLEQGKVYRHPNCKDVDMYVRRVIEESGSGLKLAVIWVTRGGYVLSADVVTLRAEDLEKWEKVYE